MLHRIKIFEPYADAIVDGKKTFEVRENDRGYNAGDMVEFDVRHMVDGLPYTTHPLHGKRYGITYVYSGLGLKDGYVVFGIKEEEGRDGSDIN